MKIKLKLPATLLICFLISCSQYTESAKDQLLQDEDYQQYLYCLNQLRKLQVARQTPPDIIIDYKKSEKERRDEYYKTLKNEKGESYHELLYKSFSLLNKLKKKYVSSRLLSKREFKEVLKDGIAQVFQQKQTLMSN